MIELVLFDLDGVLLSSKEMHRDTLNAALRLCSPEHVISDADHAANFDGLPTKTKLEMLSADRGLPKEVHAEIRTLKQQLTVDWIDANVTENPKLIRMFKNLKDGFGAQVGVISNAVSATVAAFLQRAGLLELVDITMSNEDVTRAKPNPEIYLTAMARMGVGPRSTLIVEDSTVGCEAARECVAHVLHVTCPEELTIKRVRQAMHMADDGAKAGRLIVPDLNIIVPLGGVGSRFQAAGYSLPKPMIRVLSKPMIEVVTDSIGLNAQYIFVPHRDHLAHHHIDVLLRTIEPQCQLVLEDGPRKGAAAALLLAAEHIDCSKPLLIANSDQDVAWDYPAFMQQMLVHNADAGILTFHDTEKKWSFAKLDPSTGLVSQVAEKNPISDLATCGIYYWRRGSDFCRYARQMIANGTMVNGEYYVCPVFNEAIADGARIITYNVEAMHGLGTPEDLERYLAS